ncbi:hypothetical protein CJD36_012550 [Flavipsychrobacter stenotrophus]|uniref:Tyr recombinase domain-containing protein n=1 Tax=Flavipsychrobacter stenotrophus TaxID=2077091 RepID=A0A2S7SV75_9BACT|nr:site-specific integrase [Flavipsychrobacter stenotrophus]PQJ10793.1 hypothetical protein CJD36_012550 [Flavipsychrobacter stenotrophus]
MIHVIKKERKGKKGIALCFDYRVNGVRYVESTDLHLYYATDDATKQLNKDTLMRFEIRRNKLEAKLLQGYIPLPANRQKTDFFKYFEEHFITYPTRERRAVSVLKKLKAFHKKEQLPITSIDESFLEKFKSFLENHLTGETPHNYFKLLSRVLHYATKDRLFDTNPAADIKIKRLEGITKNVLTMDELRLLTDFECSNDGVKRAFLFCCFTGLRYCDVSRLQWQHISDGKLTMVQAKTKFKVEFDLHDNALFFMGIARDPQQLIFDLPTTLNGCNKVLKGWVLKAGIDKKITWHCGRHTMACLLIALGVNDTAISKVLGQTSTKHLRNYTKRADFNLKSAISKIPLL